jgi:hypothetical protein
LRSAAFSVVSETEKRGQSGEDFEYYLGGDPGHELGFPLLPIQTLQMIREDDPRNRQPFRQRYLERIALDAAGNGADEGEACLLIVCSR